MYTRPDQLISTQEASSALEMSTSIETSRTYNKPAPVEKLPSEIGLLIFYQISDHDSLKNLIRASPTYHFLYLTAREEILTNMTIRQLVSRGFDPFSKHNVIEVYFDHRKSQLLRKDLPTLVDGAIWEAARKIYEICQHQSQVPGRGKRDFIKTDITTCLNLLRIVDSKGWRFDYSATTKRTALGGALGKRNTHMVAPITMPSYSRTGLLMYAVSRKSLRP